SQKRYNIFGSAMKPNHILNRKTQFTRQRLEILAVVRNGNHMRPCGKPSTWLTAVCSLPNSLQKFFGIALTRIEVDQQAAVGRMKTCGRIYLCLQQIKK